MSQRHFFGRKQINEPARLPETDAETDPAQTRRKILLLLMFLLSSSHFYNHSAMMTSENAKQLATSRNQLGEDVVLTIGTFFLDNRTVDVKTLTGKTVTFEWNFRYETLEELKQMTHEMEEFNSMTIAGFKKVIQDREKIPPDQQRLIIDRKQLKDKQLLCEVMGDRNRCTIYMVLRLRGAARTLQTARRQYRQAQAKKNGQKK